MAIDYTRRAPKGAPAPTPAPSGSPVVLTKSAPAVSLTKSGAARGQLRVNLNWNARPAHGLFKGQAIDLDLGAMYELTDGSRGVVQALGNSFGSLERAPYILLDGDDRSGTSAAGENLLVNLERSAALRRVLVFAYIYDGAPAFDGADAVVTLYPAAGPSVQVRLDEQAGSARSCAVALLENVGGEMVVRREVNYIHGTQEQIDAAYGFGMRWSPARK